MKYKLTNLCLALVFCASSSCSSISICTKSRITRSLEKAKSQGFAEGKAEQVRREEQRRQLEAQRPEAEVEVEIPKAIYSIPVPAHTNADGVMIEAHQVPIEIIQH